MVWKAEAPSRPCVQAPEHSRQKALYRFVPKEAQAEDQHRKLDSKYAGTMAA